MIHKIKQMKKQFFLLFFLASFSIFAQNESNWTFGGSAGFIGGTGRNSSVGFYFTPRAGYKITPQWETGITLGLHLQNSSLSSSTIFGIGPYTQYYIGRKFFVNAQFQEYIINQKIKSSDTKIGYDESALFIGGGYLQQVAPRAYIQFGAMYNILWKEGSSIFTSGFAPQIGLVYGL